MRSSRHLRRDLRFCTTDSLFSSLMVGLGECLLVPFAVAVGMNDAMVGLFTSVPFLGGSALQLATPYILKKLGSYRRFCVAAGFAQSLCFLPLAYNAWLGNISHFTLFLIATLYWGLGLATTPVWNSWVGSMMPTHLRPRYFANRNRYGQVGTLMGILASGYILQFLKGQGMELFAFGLLFLSAGISRIFSVFCLQVQGDVKDSVKNGRDISPIQLLQKLRSHGDGQLLAFIFIFQAAVNFSSPFFAPFMLKHLHMPYSEYMGLTAISIATKVFFFPVIGRWCKSFGSYNLMKVGVGAIGTLPLLWLVSTNSFYLVGVQITTGLAWATFDLGCMVAMFSTVADEERTSFLAYVNFANALAMFVGASAGAHMLTNFGEGTKVYYWIFGLSAGFRFASYFWFSKAKQTHEQQQLALAEESAKRAA